MKKVGIITVTGGLNLGNSLQNYALQKFLSDMNIDSYTILDKKYCLSKPFMWKTFLKYNFFKRLIALTFNLRGYRDTLLDGLRRQENYLLFNKNIKFAESFFEGDTFIKKEEYDFFIVGSDQVWNPNFKILDKMFLNFTDSQKKISYAASMGCENLTKKQKLLFRNKLKDFKAISVRENKAKDLLKEVLPQKHIEVLVDPTLLLSSEKWKIVEKKPNWEVPKNYILTYFLGDISDELRSLIKRFLVDKNLKIINILDKNNNDWYKIGPSEFLYLVRNADYVITDSFHGTVFSIIMKKQFMVIKRKLGKEGNMISRIDTLLTLFGLKEHLMSECTYKEINKILDYDNKNIDEIIKIEQMRAIKFLEKALS